MKTMHPEVQNQLPIHRYAYHIFRITLFFLTVCQGVNAQIISKHPKKNQDSLYFELFKINNEIDKKLAFFYVTKSLALSQQFGHINIQLKSLNALGVFYEGLNKYDSALHFYGEALELAAKNNKPERLMYTYSNLGILYLNLGVIDQSLEYSFKALKMARILKRADVEISSLHNIGFAYSKMNNYSEALIYYKESMGIIGASSKDFRTQTRINIAFILIKLKKYDEVKNTFRKIIRVETNEKFRAEAWYGLADAYLKTSNISEAKQYAVKARDLSKKINYPNFLAHSYYLLGDIAYINKEYDSAIANIEKALETAKVIKSAISQYESYLLLSKVFFDQKEFKKASVASNLAFAFKDSLFNEQFAENFKNVHLKIEKEKSDEIILAKQAQIEKQRLMKIGLSVITVLALLVIGVLWRGTIMIKRSRNKLSLASGTIEKQNEELKRFSDSLEKLVHERTEAFIILTHETKTPLTLINNYLDEHIEKSGTSYELDILKNNILKLTTYIEKNFDMERFRKGLNFYNHNQVFDLSAFLRSALIMIKSLASKHGLNIYENISDNVFIKADPGALEVLIRNIIGNSIKYTPKGGEIKVMLSVDEDTILLTVSDTGIGIPQSMHNRVFEPYFQVNKERKSEGMGIGLAIVKRIVESLEGGLKLKSEEKAGTEISIAFQRYSGLIENVTELREPINHLSPVISEEDYIPTKAIKPVTDVIGYANKPYILLVDDDETLLTYLVHKLHSYYNVYVARNGFDALQKLKKIEQLDLIITDVMMEVMDDGFTLCKKISDMEEYSHIPLIFLSARNTDHDKITAFRAGAFDYIEKPFVFSTLFQKIEAILAKFEKHRWALFNGARKNMMRPENRTNVFEANCKNYGLTKKETEIAKLLRNGLYYKEIASELKITESTVAKHIQNIYNKANVTQKLELIQKLEGKEEINITNKDDFSH